VVTCGDGVVAVDGVAAAAGAGRCGCTTRAVSVE
jgi:hypothetical protein